MALDFDKVFDDMLGAAAGVLSAEWPKVKACVEGAFKREREALEGIARARLKGEIGDEDAKSQLEDEKLVLEAELLVCKVQGKVAAQQAVNAAIGVLAAAIKGALKIV
ncbi:MAG: hypothetical protein IPK29_15540 [Betaproteobacteria bacterium]|nr:hypothetical protein [Betaproteobacteria bacterium]